MKCLFPIFLVFVVSSPCLFAATTKEGSHSIFNVLDSGASGNGKTDDSHAFIAAWKQACGASKGTPTLVIPSGKTFKLQPLRFEGPCKSQSVHVNIEGTINAPSKSDWKWSSNNKEAWIQFDNINGLVIQGKGVIDGQGAEWWRCNSNGNCDRPTALSVNGCPNVKLLGLTSKNSPRNHLSISKCNGAFISGLHINAPGESPNTDGIDISVSSHVVIQNSNIGTGDDCIAINSGSSFINITGIICGPGHGISVGSLGRNGAHSTVEDVHVRNCTFIKTTNGARIKTWKGGSGYARKITYEDIIIDHAENPLIINQEYVDSRRHVLSNHGSSSSSVALSDITFRNFRGTSASENAVQLICDKNVGCTNIVVERINILSSNGGKTNAACQNAHGRFSSSIPTIQCLR